MLYFAYGSNMDFGQMRQRCPSKYRDCGVADVVPGPWKRVCGLVSDFAEIDFGRLDRSEGFRPGRDGEENQPILAWIYLANRQPKPPRPNAEYKKLLVDGARFWHLPESYREELERIEIA